MTPLFSCVRPLGNEEPIMKGAARPPLRSQTFHSSFVPQSARFRIDPSDNISIAANFITHSEASLFFPIHTLAHASIPRSYHESRNEVRTTNPCLQASGRAEAISSRGAHNTRRDYEMFPRNGVRSSPQHPTATLHLKHHRTASSQLTALITTSLFPY